MKEVANDRKEDEDNFGPEKWENSMNESFFTRRKSIPAYSLSFKTWNEKIPSIAVNKDNVIAELTALGYMMFVSLEISPLERRQGQ